MLGDRVWKLKQNSEEILYQVCGRREPCQDDTVKRESQEDGEVRGDEKGKTGTIILIALSLLHINLFAYPNCYPLKKLDSS